MYRSISNNLSILVKLKYFWTYWSNSCGIFEMVKFTLGSKCQTAYPLTLNAVRLLYIQNQVVMLMTFSYSDSSSSAPTTEVVQSTTFTWTQVSGLVDSVYSLSLRAIHNLIECYVDQVTYKLLSSLCVTTHLKMCIILLQQNV